MWKTVNDPTEDLSYNFWIIGKLLGRAELHIEEKITMVLILDVTTNVLAFLKKISLDQG